MLTINKNVVWGSKTFHQDSKSIYSKHWIEAMHEFCHYVVATEEEKITENLGYPSINSDEFISKHLFEQEIIASELTYLMSKKLNLSEGEVAYCEYVREAHTRVDDEFIDKINYSKMNKEASKMMKKNKTVKSFLQVITA